MWFQWLIGEDVASALIAQRNARGSQPDLSVLHLLRFTADRREGGFHHRFRKTSLRDRLAEFESHVRFFKRVVEIAFSELDSVSVVVLSLGHEARERGRVHKSFTGAGLVNVNRPLGDVHRLVEVLEEG